MPVTIHDTSAEEAALAAGAPLASPADRTKDAGASATAPAAASAPPSAAAAAPAAAANGDIVNGDKSVTTTDARGRKITFKKLRSLDRFRAAGILGDQSMNMPVVAMASVALCVTKIDENPWGPLHSLREIEALISVLDDDGMDAVNLSYDRHFVTAAPSDDEVRTLVGN